MRLPIQVAIYVVRPDSNGNWEYLMLHRVLKRHQFWQGVTGGVESGETIEQTAVRELKEETRFTAESIESINYSYSFPADEFFKAIYETPPDEIVQHVFVAKVPAGSEPTLDRVEHDQYQWCSFDNALAILHWWDDKESIKRVGEFLTRNG